MKKGIIVFILVCAWVWVYASTLQAQNFIGPFPFGTGVWSSSIALGDINNDGKLDLIVTGWDAGFNPRLMEYINIGNGTFSSNSFGTGVWYSSIALGDINNDGYLDLIVTGAGIGQINEYINNGNGTFSGPTAFGTGVGYSSIALGDINNDGNLDLIVTGSTNSGVNGKLYKYINNGNGTFSGPTPFGTGVDYSSIALGDINNDGNLDLIVTGSTNGGVNGKLYKYINNGNGTFSGPTPFGTGVFASSIALGDLNNDGYLDLIVTGAGIGQINEYINNGNGTFSGPTAFGTGVGYSSIALGDINNDGNLDLIVTGSGFRLDKYINDSSGNFSGTAFGTGVDYSSIALGDINNDGNLDLIVTGGDAGNNRRLDSYFNFEVKPNSAPICPVKFYAIPNVNNWILTWNSGSDDNTPQNLLHYKVAIGTSSGNYNYTSPVINLPQGQANIGNSSLLLTTNPITSFLLTTIPVSKTVYWKVSTIDSAFLSSSFSAEQVATLKANPCYPKNIAVSNSRPLFIWNKKTVDSNVIQVSSNSFTKIAIRSNIALSTNFTPSINLKIGTNFWRVITYRQSCNTYFTSAIATFTVLEIAPLKPILCYPVNIAVSNSRPEFIWNMKSVDSNIIQISYNAFTSIAIKSNVVLNTNFTPNFNLNVGAISWRAINYSLSFNSYFTSSMASFTINKTAPVLNIDKLSGSYTGSLVINITAYKDTGKTIFNTNAICYATLFKNNVAFSNLSQLNTLQITFTTPGKYSVQAYAIDTANNKSTLIQNDYTLVSLPLQPAAVYPTVINLNQRNTASFISSEKATGVDVKIMTISGILIQEIKNVDFSTGVYVWTINNQSLFPTGQYIVKIGDQRTFMEIIK